MLLGREPGGAADRRPEGVARGPAALVRDAQAPPAAVESVVTEAGGLGEAGVAHGEEGGGPGLLLPWPGCCSARVARVLRVSPSQPRWTQLLLSVSAFAP